MVNGLVEDFRVTNNYVHEVNNIAIDIIGYEKNDTETTSRGLVADNVVLDASNYWPSSGQDCSRGNCTYPPGDESSDGIYVDGGAGIDIEYNVVGRTDHGIELQSENGQLIRDVQVRHNRGLQQELQGLHDRPVRERDRERQRVLHGSGPGQRGPGDVQVGCVRRRWQRPTP